MISTKKIETLIAGKVNGKYILSNGFCVWPHDISDIKNRYKLSKDKPNQTEFDAKLLRLDTFVYRDKKISDFNTNFEITMRDALDFDKKEYNIKLKYTGFKTQYFDATNSVFLDDDGNAYEYNDEYFDLILKGYLQFLNVELFVKQVSVKMGGTNALAKIVLHGEIIGSIMPVKTTDKKYKIIKI